MQEEVAGKKWIASDEKADYDARCFSQILSDF